MRQAVSIDDIGLLVSMVIDSWDPPIGRARPRLALPITKLVFSAKIAFVIPRHEISTSWEIGIADQ